MSDQFNSSQPARPDRPERPDKWKSIHPSGPAHGPRIPIKPPKLSAASKRSPVQLQQTLIPIMLTLGLMSCGIGAAQWMADPDYPFSARKMIGCAIALPVVGLLLIALAVMTMRWVRRKLSD